MLTEVETEMSTSNCTCTCTLCTSYKRGVSGSATSCLNGNVNHLPSSNEEIESLVQVKVIVSVAKMETKLRSI